MYRIKQFKNFVGLQIMTTNPQKHFKDKFLKIFNLFYCFFMSILCFICSMLLIIGTVKKISLYLKISAFGFCGICTITVIYQIINKRKNITYSILTLLAIALFVIAFYI